MIEFVKNQEKTSCCGCQVCEQVCSHHAISMYEDDEGFVFPKVNEDLCTNCGLCEKVCPIENGMKRKVTPNVYIAQLKDKGLLEMSSSGGIFTALAENTLLHGGVVYGAAWHENLILKHIRVTEKSELRRIRGSKYLQSNTSGVFVDVKKDLREGRKVYFTGTPCQVEALNLFLHKTYPNLLTSDLICHGVPSQRIFTTIKQYLGSSNKGIVTNYSFRDKSVFGWSCSSSCSIQKESGRSVLLRYDPNMKAYFNAFILGKLMRYSCYACPFAKSERVGDITIADFWGAEQYFKQQFDLSKGVSLVLVNSSKGSEIYKEVSSEIFSIPTKLEYASLSNENLVHPINKPNDRDKVYKMAFSEYDKFVRCYIGRNLLLDRVLGHIILIVYPHKRIYNSLSFIKRSLKK